MNRDRDLVSSYDVHVGFWIRHTHGLIRGATLTLTRRSGAVLIAFLAIYVGLAGHCCWDIIRYILHRHLSTLEATDGLHHQRQAILRNSETAHAAAWEFFQIGIAWRSQRTKRVARRLLPVVILSVCTSLLITAAGLMSSHVALTANEVLLSGRSCGSLMPDFNSTTVNTAEVTAANNAYQYQKYTEFLAYALQCYRGDQKSEKCRTYKKPVLGYQKQVNASCPFDQTFCKLRDGNLILETDFLHSDADLGINGGPEFFLKQKRHCAPIVSDQFREDVTDPTVNQEVTRYSFKLVGNATGLEVNFDEYNYAWQVSKSDATTGQGLGAMSFRGYKLGLYSGRPSPRTDREDLTYFEAQHLDAQVSLIFMESSGLIYFLPIADPWFSAQTLSTVESDNDAGFFFMQDEPASVMACVTDTQVCNPLLHGADRCVQAYSLKELAVSLSTLWPNDNDRASVNGALRFMNAQVDGTSRVFDADMFYSLPDIPNLITRFSQGVIPARHSTIPSNRWQDELELTFQASLASLQSYLVETASGELQWARADENTMLYEEVCQPYGSCTAVCHRQLIKSPGHYSFSLLGLALILCVGGVFILAGYGIEYIAMFVDWIRQLGRGGSTPATTYAQAEWQVGSPLQLQRLAHEALGSGDWKGADSAVPVTQSGDVLGVLDVSDHRHPRLRHPSTFSESMTTGRSFDGEKQATVTSRPVMRDADTWTERDSFLARGEGTEANKM